VFPVADGDTGTNMLLTVRGTVDALECSSAADRAALADDAAEAALRGAQGNSGVILAEALRGALGVLRESDDLAAAFRAASDAAYGAVREPREGTMLTVLRELAEEAEAGGDLAALVARGDECVTRTTDLLEQLREAGVVDAGAAGVVELVRGAAGVVLGKALPPAPERRIAAVHLTPSRFRFCTAFLLEGEDLDAAALERELAPLGDSLLVVGAGSLLKAHVHTDEPERALTAGRALGTISGITVADMHEQARAREERLRTACAAVAVAPGAGNRRLFESLGAIAVGGPGEVGHAVESADADEVLVLANGADVGAWPHLLATGSIPEGLSAMVAFDPARPAEENLAAMSDAAARVVTGAVAVRDGGFVGVVAGHELAAPTSFDEAALSVIERLLAEPREVLTFLTGDGPPALDGLLAALDSRHPAVEYEVHDGGQPGYPLLLSAE
jgi:DAK2 domain fusion protein YloV